jgi:MFS family permease
VATRVETDPAGNPLDRFGLSRPVWLLGWVSFFTDSASEMVYPLLPLFLTQVLGASAMSLGVIEGVAEGTSSILKIVSGWMSDRTGTPKRLVVAGYGLSSLVRPLISFVTAWPQVLALRFVDRIGKGVRTSPRDAMLASFAPERLRGRVYGFHRAMDHSGAVAGPLIAAVYLHYHPEAYRALFTWTLVPGLIVLALTLRLPTSRRPGTSRPRSTDHGSRTTDHASRTTGHGPRPTYLGPRFYAAMSVITLFALGNASDSFILLRLSNLGVAAAWIPLLWSALHVVKMIVSITGGALSDRFGRRTLIALGYLWYAAIYAAFAYMTTLEWTIVVFLAYGVYFGLTEGVEKAWVADMAPTGAGGVAFGTYNAAIGFGGLAASVLFGWIWTRVSPAAAFLTGAGLALAASLLLYLAFSDATDSRHQ